MKTCPDCKLVIPENQEEFKECYKKRPICKCIATDIPVPTPPKELLKVTDKKPCPHKFASAVLQDGKYKQELVIYCTNCGGRIYTLVRE